MQRLLSKRTQYHFNPRSREGSDIRSGRGGQAVAHFNPRSREGSDIEAAEPARSTNISIHAPVKGATQNCLTWQQSAEHFNPRSREGSDTDRFRLTGGTKYFNPRSREGSDL